MLGLLQTILNLLKSLPWDIYQELGAVAAGPERRIKSYAGHQDKSPPGTPGDKLELHVKVQWKKPLFHRILWRLSQEGAAGVILRSGGEEF